MWKAERIKALREAFGDTQEEFAGRIRVSVPTVKHWEQDKGEPIGPAQLLFDRLEQDLRDLAIKLNLTEEPAVAKWVKGEAPLDARVASILGQWFEAVRAETTDHKSLTKREKQPA